MPARLYLDEHVDVEVAFRLQAEGHDVLTTQAAGHKNKSVSDEAQLAFATSQSRILYTQNICDFKPLSERWAREGREHAGLMYSSFDTPGVLYQWITDALGLYPDGIHNCTLSLPIAG